MKAATGEARGLRRGSWTGSTAGNNRTAENSSSVKGGIRKIEKYTTGSFLKETLTDLFFPRRCPVCDRPVRPFGAVICDGCREKIPKIRAPFCRVCGRELSVRGEGVCPDCLRAGHRFERGIALYPYRDASGSIYRFKYGGRAEYAAFYAEEMAKRVKEEFSADMPDRLVAVPGAPDRVRKRGYDQAQVLAEELSKKLGIPLLKDALTTTQDTPAMRGRGLSERRKNLKKALIVHADDVKFNVIMLVDDIYTTGATMDACAALLKEAGALRVYFVTIAVGENGL